MRLFRDPVSEAETATGWVNHDFKVPATEWTPELRQAYETMSKAMGTAADESIALAKKTPHRVMRELYEQFIAYSREFVNSIAAYTEVDIHLANTAAQTRVVILYVCEAIKFKSAEARGVLIPDPAAPSALAELGDPNNPQRFMTSVDAQCPKWQSLSDDFHAVSKPWGDLDPNVPADKWSTEQHALVEAVIPVMNQYADDIESLGRNSSNPIIEDFAVLSSQYWRAYTSALPKYSTSDFYLSQVAKRVPDLIVQACQGFGG